MILTKELWAVTPSFEQQNVDADSRLDVVHVPDAELVVDSGSDSESDDDERLSVVRDKHQKSMQKFSFVLLEERVILLQRNATVIM